MPDRVVAGPLVIDLDPGEAGRVLRLQGELDLASAPLLEGEIEDADAAGETWLVIDLSRLEFVDSTGLSVLLQASRRAKANGRRLSLLRGPRAVQRLFELTGTSSQFTFDD